MQTDDASRWCRHTEYNGNTFVSVSQILMEWGQFFVRQDNIRQTIVYEVCLSITTCSVSTINILYAEISIKVCTCSNSRCTLQWSPQQPIIIWYDNGWYSNGCIYPIPEILPRIWNLPVRYTKTTQVVMQKPVWFCVAKIHGFQIKSNFDGIVAYTTMLLWQPNDIFHFEFKTFLA